MLKDSRAITSDLDNHLTFPMEKFFIFVNTIILCFSNNVYNDEFCE